MQESRKVQTIHGKLAEARRSPFRTYRELTVGERSLFRFAWYELLTSFLGPLPGALGLVLRKLFYPTLFRKAGRGLVVGRNVVIRHPGRIELGDNVTIDDNCVLDARGGGEAGLVIRDNVLVNRNCLILAKAGPIRIDRRTSIGSNSVIVSLSGVEIGEAVLAAGGISITAGAYHFEDPTCPVMDQGTYTKGPIRIGSGAWIGTGAIILDGISVGEGAVVGAGAVVTRDVPRLCVVAGSPARILRRRTGGRSSH